MNPPTFENPYKIYGVLVVGIDERGIDTIEALKEIGKKLLEIGESARKTPHAITKQLFFTLTDSKEIT